MPVFKQNQSIEDLLEEFHTQNESFEQDADTNADIKQTIDDLLEQFYSLNDYYQADNDAKDSSKTDNTSGDCSDTVSRTIPDANLDNSLDTRYSTEEGLLLRKDPGNQTSSTTDSGAECGLAHAKHVTSTVWDALDKAEQSSPAASTQDNDTPNTYARNSGPASTSLPHRKSREAAHERASFDRKVHGEIRPIHAVAYTKNDPIHLHPPTSSPRSSHASLNATTIQPGPSAAESASRPAGKLPAHRRWLKRMKRSMKSHFGPKRGGGGSPSRS